MNKTTIIILTSFAPSNSTYGFIDSLCWQQCNNQVQRGRPNSISPPRASWGKTNGYRVLIVHTNVWCVPFGNCSTFFCIPTCCCCCCSVPCNISYFFFCTTSLINYKKNTVRWRIRFYNRASTHTHTHPIAYQQRCIFLKGTHARDACFVLDERFPPHPHTVWGTCRVKWDSCLIILFSYFLFLFYVFSYALILLDFLCNFTPKYKAISQIMLV